MPITDAPLPVGLNTDSYCDLHRKCASLRSLEGPTKGRVIAKPKEVVLRDVTFRVNAGGLRRTREEKVRNVHAYARGRVDGSDVTRVTSQPDAVPVTYNPFRFDTFVRTDTGAPILHADLFAIVGKKAWALGVS